MRTHTRLAMLSAFTLALFSVTAVAGQNPAPNRPGGVVIVKAGEVQWTDYPGRPGVKLAMIEGDLTKPGPFLMRVKFPAGYTLPGHMHPGVEHTVILAGALKVAYGSADATPEVLPAGSVIVTPANTPHFVSTTVETIVQTHGIGPWSSTPVK